MSSVGLCRAEWRFGELEDVGGAVALKHFGYKCAGLDLAGDRDVVGEFLELAVFSVAMERRAVAPRRSRSRACE